VPQGRKPVDFQTIANAPGRGIRVSQYRVAVLLQDRAPVDHLRPASSSAPAVSVEPRDAVHDVW